jgi:hypothetical protein
MARSSECRDYYARKVLDTADIVRDDIVRDAIFASCPKNRRNTGPGATVTATAIRSTYRFDDAGGC